MLEADGDRGFFGRDTFRGGTRGGQTLDNPPQTRDVVRTRGRIGTGFGRATQHQVITVEFEKDPNVPPQEITLRYDTEANLRERGIVTSTPHKVDDVRLARPFPADEGCTPPRDWRRGSVRPHGR